MASDYTNSKGTLGAVFPDNAVDTSYERLEPLLTAQQLVNRFLAGIPLVSQIKNPITGKYHQITDEQIVDIINGAVSQIELDVGIDIFPVRRQQKFPFDRNEYDSWGFFQLPHRPCSSIEKLSIVPADGSEIYQVPQNWIETANLIHGQLNIIPIGIATVNQGLIGSGYHSGAFFLTVLQFNTWVPAFWQIEATYGYPDGKVPRVVNEAIGALAAKEILGMLGATFAKAQSYSLGIDGMSQSISNSPNIFEPRIGRLQEKYDLLVGKLRGYYQLKFYTDTL